jgi:hypothetical protein
MHSSPTVLFARAPIGLGPQLCPPFRHAPTDFLGTRPRLGFGIFAAGLLIASSVLAAFDVGPFLREHSVPGMIGFAVSAIVALRTFRK